MTRIKEIEAFMAKSSSEGVANPFVRVDPDLVSGISDERFYFYLELIKEALGSADPKIKEVETVLSYITEINDKATDQILRVLWNERARAMYHLMGRASTDGGSMDIVSVAGFTFSEKDGGWVFA